MHHETETGRALREAAQTRIHKIRAQYNAAEVAIRCITLEIARATSATPAQVIARKRLRRRMMSQRRDELLRQLSVALADLDALCPAGPLCPHELQRSITSTRKPRVLTGEASS